MHLPTPVLFLFRASLLYCSSRGAGDYRFGVSQHIRDAGNGSVNSGRGANNRFLKRKVNEYFSVDTSTGMGDCIGECIIFLLVQQKYVFDV